MKTIKVGFCGHSGSGKTTQANLIQERLGLKFKENSAGLLMAEEVQNELVNKYGWTQSGHKDVIRLSHINPEFGWEFQKAVLEARVSFIAENDNFVIDRTPLDNLSYFMLQCSPLMGATRCEFFINRCMRAFNELTHVIFLSNPTLEIEDNGSRVDNPYYQRMVTAVFEDTYERYFKDNCPNTKILRIDTWGEIEDRYKLIAEFLNN